MYRSGGGFIVNSERIRRDVIAIGASAGGVSPLIRLLADLPPDLAASVVVCVHRSPIRITNLVDVLARRSRVPVVEPQDGAPLDRGVVYLAPRDHHLVLEDGVLRATRGPREHMARPAIDPLFRSAAAAYEARVVGLLLSGMGRDGVDGLVAIKRVGGLSLAQDPKEAEFPA